MYPTILDRIRYPTKMHIMGLSIILSMLLLNTKPGIGLNPNPNQARPIVFYRPGNATEGVPNPQAIENSEIFTTLLFCGKFKSSRHDIVHSQSIIDFHHI